jgi:hypothetical protein
MCALQMMLQSLQQCIAIVATLSMRNVNGGKSVKELIDSTDAIQMMQRIQTRIDLIVENRCGKEIKPDFCHRDCNHSAQKCCPTRRKFND